MFRSIPAIAAVGLIGTAFGQSATVSIEGPSTLGAGESTTITVRATYDLAGAGAGVFGSAGLFGFGGDASGTGPAAASAQAINGSLPFGATAGTISGASVLQIAAGAGAPATLTANPVDLFTFTITADAGATDGQQIVVDFDGAVVLALGDDLETYSTNPGVNQSTLTVQPLTITIGSAAGCLADFDGDTVPSTAGDLFAFFGALAAGIDVDGDTVNSTAGDLFFFFGALAAGCP